VKFQRYVARLPDVDSGVQPVYLVLNGNFFMMRDTIKFANSRATGLKRNK